LTSTHSSNQNINSLSVTDTDTNIYTSIYSSKKGDLFIPKRDLFTHKRDLKTGFL